MASRRRNRCRGGVHPERIIIVTHEFFPFPGGIAVYVEETARVLAASGRDVEVWCPANAAAFKNKEFPFRVVQMPARGSQDWSCRRATVKVWRARAGDVRGATLWLPEPGAILTAFYDFLFRLPSPQKLVLTLHGSEILNFSRSAHRRYLFNRLLRKADAVGVVSEYCKELLLGRARVSENQLRVVPGALRLDFENAAPAEKPENSGGEIVIACAARIHPRKGQNLLIKAVGALPAALRERVCVRFAGKVNREEYLKDLKKLAADCGVRAEFTGGLEGDALKNFYAAGDIFALTSISLKNSVESFGMVYLEAGAFGLPVVGHATGGVGEAVLDGETGLLVPEDDGAALTAALKKLIESPALRMRLGAGGRVHAKKFSWENNARALFG